MAYAETAACWGIDLPLGNPRGAWPASGTRRARPRASWGRHRARVASSQMEELDYPRFLNQRSIA
jgi:hypothetical protein